jgi:hypothetical protein
MAMVVGKLGSAQLSLHTTGVLRKWASQTASDQAKLPICRPVLPRRRVGAAGHEQRLLVLHQFSERAHHAQALCGLDQHHSKSPLKKGKINTSTRSAGER